ncbi:hypothetical protein AK88_05607 [Plasmodium fragile]|uniref:Schizont-infected cell agglutination extracellular alpha domain-containing protein n=1 Tax=Plasmodium fragile TaxID=5857 RepID=A0A0D9QGC6_PLAFR|nr:uncharacterized protein AK88_05607 [Plasmodium fragile]KJP84761.1 hypothetical protein AK88_05607 [Plasmodium fragile]
MNDDSEYDNAVNCENAYWEHPIDDGQPNQPQREMSRRTERVICRLMTQAIYFANAWSPEVRQNAQEIEGRDKEIKGIMRCTIANIYQDILRTYACEGWWGTYYAWYTTQIIWDALKDTLGEHHCKRGMYKNIKLGDWPMRQQMKTWLQQNARMQKKLAQEQIHDGCRGGTVKTKGKLQVEGVIKDDESETKKDEELKTQMKGDITKILGDVKRKMKQEQEAVTLKASSGAAPPDPYVDDAHEKKDAAIENEMQQAIAHVKEELDAVIAKTAAAQDAAAKAATTPSKASPAPSLYHFG